MSIEYTQSPAASATTVSPGVGTTGFTSFRLPFATSVGTLTDSTLSPRVSTGGVVLGQTSASRVGFFGSTGASQPSSYTTAATIGTTRTNPAVSATTITTNTTNIGPHGFASTADMAAHAASHAAIVTDLTNITRLLNSLINDHKALGLSG